MNQVGSTVSLIHINKYTHLSKEISLDDNQLLVDFFRIYFPAPGSFFNPQEKSER